MNQCLVVLDGERCSWPPHAGNVHNIMGTEASVPKTDCPAGCDHQRGRLGLCADHAIAASEDRLTCSCPRDDTALVLRWVADTPMPQVQETISTQIPKRIIEAARRAVQ